jgi:hypothetical protein
MINSIFDEFVGKDYSAEGNNTFKDYTTPQNILKRIKKKSGKFLTAKYNNTKN